MTLEEAIKYCEEVAKLKEYRVDEEKEIAYARLKAPTNDMRPMAEIEKLNMEAERYRQLVEWLKALKEIWDSGDYNDCLHSKNCTIRPKLGQMVRYNCYQYERRIDEEVNADE